MIVRLLLGWIILVMLSGIVYSFLGIGFEMLSRCLFLIIIVGLFLWM